MTSETKMQRFTMYRLNVPDATHNADQKNPPDQPQFEGVQFSDGSVAIRWLTAVASTSVWKSLEDALRIHGHPEYDSKLLLHDGADVGATLRQQLTTAREGLEGIDTLVSDQSGRAWLAILIEIKNAVRDTLAKIGGETK